jgi:hypothetical protein
MQHASSRSNAPFGHADDRSDRHDRHDRHDRFRGRSPFVRWQALATGSLVGIAAWAFAYTLGAAIWLSLVPGPGGVHGTSQVLLGLYGAVAASFALAAGAWVAARVGGAHTVETAALYGVCMWSLSTITLTAVAMLAASESLGMPAGGLGACLDVGLAAIGLLSGAARSPVVTLWAMVATVSLSLLFALGGAFRALPKDAATRP